MRPVWHWPMETSHSFLFETFCRPNIIKWLKLCTCGLINREALAQVYSLIMAMILYAHTHTEEINKGSFFFVFLGVVPDYLHQELTSRYLSVPKQGSPNSLWLLGTQHQEFFSHLHGIKLHNFGIRTKTLLGITCFSLTILRELAA